MSTAAIAKFSLLASRYSDLAREVEQGGPAAQAAQLEMGMIETEVAHLGVSKTEFRAASPQQRGQLVMAAQERKRNEAAFRETVATSRTRNVGFETAPPAKHWHSYGEIPDTRFAVGTLGAMSRVVDTKTGAEYERNFHEAVRIDSQTLLTKLGDRGDEPDTLQVLDLETGKTRSVAEYEQQTGRSLSELYRREGPGIVVSGGRTSVRTRESIELVKVDWPQRS